MYVRTTQRRNKDGSVVRYVALAHNRREGAKTKAEVLLNLGREDRLDTDELRRLVGSISRYLGDDSALDGQLPWGGRPSWDDLDVLASRPLGAAWLLDGLWRRLGIAEMLQAAVGGRRFTTDVERVLFALVANRAIAPCSKLAAAEWASEDAVMSSPSSTGAFRPGRTLEYLRRAGGHWIAGERMRDGTAEHEQVLSRPGRYQQVADNLRVKEVRLDDHGQRRFIVCHNPVEADRDRAGRDDMIARLEAELARIDTARARTAKAKPGTRRDREQAAHTRAECALRDHPTLGRYLRQLKDGRLRIDRAKVTAEQRLDGKYLLSTSDPDLSAADVALGYKNLLEAERGFRDLKSTLELRPVFHWLGHRITAHVLLCWLALLLIRVAERSTGQTWRRIATELGRLHEVTVAFDTGTATCTSALSDAHKAIFRACDDTPRHRGSPTSTPPEPRAGRGHTPHPARKRRSRRSTPPSEPYACPQAAELGTTGAARTRESCPTAA